MNHRKTHTLLASLSWVPVRLQAVLLQARAPTRVVAVALAQAALVMGAVLQVQMEAPQQAVGLVLAPVEDQAAAQVGLQVVVREPLEGVVLAGVVAVDAVAGEVDEEGTIYLGRQD